MQKLCVVGMGYIGLPTATLFADAGVKVAGVDVSPSIIETINSGRAHFGEANLDALLAKVVASGKLKAHAAPQAADAFILAVPTPFLPEHQPDLTYVIAAAKSIAPVLAKGNLVVLESTSPVGTTEQVCELLASLRPDLTFPREGVHKPDVCVAYCPERVLPGRILDELVNNARVIGGVTRACGQRALKLYKIIVKGTCSVTTARTAEMAKLAENAFRDVNIAYANELSVICDKIGVDVWELIKITNLHPRVKILEPGPGVGGHCIAVDPWFIVAKTPAEAKLIRAAREVNDAKPHFVLSKLRKMISEFPSRPKVACLGLSYKADVDDLRESPAVEIVHLLAADKTSDVVVVEPHINQLPRPLAGSPVELWTLERALTECDIIVLLVDHRPFKSIKAKRLSGKRVLDTRGVWRPAHEDDMQSDSVKGDAEELAAI